MRKPVINAVMFQRVLTVVASPVVVVYLAAYAPQLSIGFEFTLGSKLTGMVQYLTWVTRDSMVNARSLA